MCLGWYCNDDNDPCFGMLEYLIHLFCEHKGMIQSSSWCLMIHCRTLEFPVFTLPNCDAAFVRCPPNKYSNRSRPSKLSIEIWNNQLGRLTRGKSQASSYDVLGPHANGPSTQHAEIKSMLVLISSGRFPCALAWLRPSLPQVHPLWGWCPHWSAAKASQGFIHMRLTNSWACFPDTSHNDRRNSSHKSQLRQQISARIQNR